jgi:hypothetical protein
MVRERRKSCEVLGAIKGQRKPRIIKAISATSSISRHIGECLSCYDWPESGNISSQKLFPQTFNRTSIAPRRAP